jgi:hypothetical protein
MSRLGPYSEKHHHASLFVYSDKKIMSHYITVSNLRQNNLAIRGLFQGNAFVTAPLLSVKHRPVILASSFLLYFEVFYFHFACMYDREYYTSKIRPTTLSLHTSKAGHSGRLFWLGPSFSRLTLSWAWPEMVMDRVEPKILDGCGPKTQPARLGPAHQLAIFFFI